MRSRYVLDIREEVLPQEVLEEITRMLRDYELDYNNQFMEWSHEELGPDYPVLDKYLVDKNIASCVILSWW